MINMSSVYTIHIIFCVIKKLKSILLLNVWSNQSLFNTSSFWLL
jgi:hypothetical protein